MKQLFVYVFCLFVGLPIVMFSVHLATMPEDEREKLNESAQDLNGRIYKARIYCPRSRNEHVVRVHGRSRDDARRKVQRQLENCDVEILEGASAPIWQKAIRDAL